MHLVISMAEFYCSIAKLLSDVFISRFSIRITLLCNLLRLLVAVKNYDLLVTSLQYTVTFLMTVKKTIFFFLFFSLVFLLKHI